MKSNTISKKLKFNSSFIQEFHPGKTTSEDISKLSVFHYTSPDALLSIINGRFLRFSDIRYMNDRSELIFFVKRLVEFVEKNADIYSYFNDAVNLLLKKHKFTELKDLDIAEIDYNAATPRLRSFIFCTCTDSDSLNMWNYYASNGTYTGYSIGFSVKDFLKTFDVDDPKELDAFNVYYGKVIYEEKKQFEAIKELAESIENYHKRYEKQFSLESAATVIRLYIDTRGPFFKSDRFKSEKEFRFLVSISDRRIARSEEEAKKYFGKNNKTMVEGFFARNGLIVPYLQVSIPTNAITRLTISPMTEFLIAKSSLKELLEQKGFKTNSGQEIPVFRSKIPIRF